MNTALMLPLVALAGLAGGAVLLTRVLQGRRSGAGLREDLMALARERDLSLLDEAHLPGQLLEAARALGGRGRRAGLSAVLRGSDDQGTWYLARRRRGRQVQQCLLFENKLLTVKGLRILPTRSRRRGRVEPLHLRLEWEAEAERIDHRSMLMAHELFVLISEARKVVEPLGLHLVVDDQRVLVHTRRPLGGDALRLFLEVALEIRARALDAPRQSGALRLRPGDSGKVLPVGGPITEAVRLARKMEEESGAEVPYGALRTEDKRPVRRRTGRVSAPKVEVIR